MRKFLYPFFALVIVLQIVSSPVSTNAAELVYFSEPNEGEYAPLHPYTLNWTGDVLSDGRLNLTTMILHGKGEGDNADIVITSKEIGASAIYDLGSNANLTDSISPDSYRGNWETYFPLTYSTYLIKTHNNKYAKIQIDEILPSKVLFTYVLQSDSPNEETWKDFGIKTNQPHDKTWTIKLSKEVDASSVNSQNVYVTTESGTRVNVTVKVDPSDDKNILVQPPTDGYTHGATYTLYVKDILDRAERKPIKENVKMTFIIENKAQDPNPPTDVKGVADDGEFHLSWTHSQSSNIDGYSIWYSYDGINYTRLTNSLTNSSIFRGNNFTIKATNGTKVFIYVTAVDLKGNESLKSNTVTVTPSAGNSSTLLAPTIHDKNFGNGWISINWYDKVDPDFRGFYVYVKEASANTYQKVVFPNGYSLIEATEAVIDKLENGVTYNIYVIALYKNGESAPSNIETITPTADYNQTWEGVWDTKYGIMELRQDGNKVSGTYVDDGFSGEITGEVQNDNLLGVFYQSGYSYGYMEFKMSSDGQSFTGRFQYEGRTDWAYWDGTRLE